MDVTLDEEMIRYFGDFGFIYGENRPFTIEWENRQAFGEALLARLLGFDQE